MAEFCACYASTAKREPLKVCKQCGKDATRNAIIRENN